MIEFASATPAGCTIITNVESPDTSTRHLVFGSDAWANNNAAFAETRCADDLLPASVYFAELERSWSRERFDLANVRDEQVMYSGTSYSTRDDSVGYNDGDNRAALHTNLAEAEELPIGHSILTHMFGTAGYAGPRYIHRDIVDKWPSTYRKTKTGYVHTGRIYRTRKMMGPRYSFVILSMNK